MSRPRLLAVIGIVLGLAICHVAQFGSVPYGCMETPCNASPPPEDVVSGYVFYGGLAAILVSVVAFAFASKRPKAVSRVCYSVLAIGLVVLVGSPLYFADPVIFIPNVTLIGHVASPSNSTQVSFVANGHSYTATVQQGSFSISLPNGVSYTATVSYSGNGNCPTQAVKVLSYSPSMTLNGFGC